MCCDGWVRRWSDLSAESRDLLVVAAQFAFCCALYATNIYRFVPDRVDVPLWGRIVVLALLCACSLLRRHAPVLALGLAVVPFGLDLMLGATLPVWLIVSDLVYCVALYGTDRQSIGILRLSAAVSVLTCGLVYAVTGEGQEVIVTIGAAAAFLGTPLWWARSVRQHKQIARTEFERAEAATVIAELDRRAAVEAERARMARDLHDVVAGHLSAIAIQSAAALRIVETRDGSPVGIGGPGVHDIVTSIRANSIDALTEMRSMIGLLRGDGAADEPLSPGRVEELHRLVTSARASGTDVHIDGDCAPGAHRTPVLPAAVDHAAYRIVQEALTNAVVHAPGAATGVDIRCDGDALTIVITNDMTPTDSDHPGRVDGRTGTGLSNMRQRAELLGGILHAGCEGDRWCVKAVLPIATSTAR